MACVRGNSQYIIETKRKFYTAMKEKRFRDAIELVGRNDWLPLSIGYTSITCAGAWGMSMWKHFGDMIEKDNNYANDQTVKEFAIFIADHATKDFSLVLLLNYAVAGNWIDIGAECIKNLGFDSKTKEALYDRIKSEEMKSLFDSWTE